MPKYRVRLSDGRIVTVQSDQPPTEEQILSQLGQRTPEPTPSTAAASPSSPAGGMLPTAGAFGGSLLGTIGGIPGRIAGAAVGGALGKGAEMLMDDTDQGFMEGAQAMGTEALKQGGFEAAGGMAGKALGAAGRGLYRVALRPSKTLQQKYPGIIAAGIRERLPVSAKGTATAQARTTASKAKADELIAAAERGGASPVSPREVVSELRPVRDTIQKRAQLGVVDETPQLAARAKALAARNKGGIPLTKAQELKREAQTMADTAYRAQEKGAIINSTEAMTNAGVARGLRQAIETRVPGVVDVNKRTRELAGLTKALEDSEMRTHILGGLITPAAVGVGGGLASGDPVTGLASGLAVRGLQSPGVLSRVGIAASRSAPAATLTPQAVRLAQMIQELLTREQEAQ